MTTLTSPHDLLAAVPFLIGYHPENSLVVIALAGESVGMAMRVDFPLDPDPDQIDALATHLVKDSCDAALLVSYLPSNVTDAEFIIAPLSEALEMRGISIRESLEIKGERWRSLLCQDKDCCPPQGNAMPDISSSRVAAEQVAAGRRLPFRDLDSLKAALSERKPDPQLNKLLKQVPDLDYEGGQLRAKQREAAVATIELLKDFELQGYSDNKALIALVLARLEDLQVRDYAMGITTSENIEALGTMWFSLLRMAPKQYLAPVATLYSAVCYENGDGTLAQRALDRAFEADLAYPLAKLLRRVFAAGWPPESFAQMRAELHPKICASLFGE